MIIFKEVIAWFTGDSNDVNYSMDTQVYSVCLYVRVMKPVERRIYIYDTCSPKKLMSSGSLDWNWYFYSFRVFHSIINNLSYRRPAPRSGWSIITENICWIHWKSFLLNIQFIIKFDNVFTQKNHFNFFFFNLWRTDLRRTNLGRMDSGRTKIKANSVIGERIWRANEQIFIP